LKPLKIKKINLIYFKLKKYYPPDYQIGTSKRET
jgi:hypothetical protein